MSDVKVASIVIDTQDVEPLVEFWTTLLGLEVRHRIGSYFVWLDRVSEGGPSLAFQLVPEPKEGKNRLHLDLGVPDRETTVARVVELGGSRIADHEIEGFHWTVCGDPQGNEFCVANAG